MSWMQAIVNRALALDPEVRAELQQFEHKAIQLQFAEWPDPLFVIVQAQEIQLLTHYDGQVDTVIKGTVPAMIRVAIEQRLQPSSRLTGLVIEGDMELAADCARLLRKFRIDWEEVLAKFVGDMAAHQVGEVARSFATWGRDASSSFAQDVSEYLQEEIRLVPPAEELRDFYQDVDKLRDDVERFAVKVALYRNQGS